MSVVEEDTKILKDFIDESVERMEKGEYAYVTGGYCTYNHRDSVLNDHCDKIVNKLVSLGYEYTTNHGFGCKDYKFSKKIVL